MAAAQIIALNARCTAQLFRAPEEEDSFLVLYGWGANRNTEHQGQQWLLSITSGHLDTMIRQLDEPVRSDDGPDGRPLHILLAIGNTATAEFIHDQQLWPYVHLRGYDNGREFDVIIERDVLADLRDHLHAAPIQDDAKSFAHLSQLAF